MRRLLTYVTLIMVLFPANRICGQPEGENLSWTFAKCLKYASDHNIQINTLRLSQQSLTQDLIAARGAKLPGLSGRFDNTFNNSNNPDENSGLINQLISSGTYSLQSSVVLWNDNYLNNNVRLHRLQIRSADLLVEQSLNNITLLITQEFLNILLAKENLKYVTDLVSTSDARVKQGQMFYTEGSIAKKDLLQLQAQLASDKFLLVQTENAIRQNILALKQTLQLPSGAAFDVVSPDTVVVPRFLRPLLEVRQEALANFPDVKLGKLGLEVASLNIALAKALSKPVISMNALLGTGYSDVVTNSYGPKTGYFVQAGDNFYQRVGITVVLPLFSNYINRTNMQKAKIAFNVAQLNFQNDEILLSQDVEQAYLNASNAVESYHAAEVQLHAATESYRITNEQFRLGGTNIYDLLQERNQYVQAIQAFTQAKYTAMLQEKIYEFYMGKPITF